MGASNSAIQALSQNVHILINEFPDKPHVGDITIKNDKIYCYGTDSKFIPISSTIAETKVASYQENTDKKPIAKICTQCGATLQGNKCRFCDTEFDFI